MDSTQANNYIKENLPLIEYLKPAPNHKGNTGYICPACGSGTHSGSKSTGALEYYPQTNSWYCYSCRAGGDIFNYYRYQTGATYGEALEALAKAAGITIDGSGTQKPDKVPTRKPEPQEAPETEKPQTDTEPANYNDYYIKCFDNLENYPEAVEYLKGRGISLTTAHRLLIGFDPQADPATAPGALADEYKPHATPRIIAPCTNDFYIARRIDPDPQYKKINPAGSNTRIFNTIAIYSKRTKYCFVVEGFFDALAVEEHGHEAIALSSAGNGQLLIDQLEKRPAVGKTFIICFDKDPDPNTRATVEKEAADLAAELTKLNYKAVLFNISGSSGDPNDAAVKDPAKFEQMLTDAEATADRDELDDFLDKIQTKAYQPISSGLPYFDELTGGTLPQSLTVLLGEPGSGKTILMQELAEAMATHNAGRPIVYLNFETAKEYLFARAISARLYRRGNIKRTAKQILQGYKWNEKERKEITATIEDYRRESLPHISYNPAEVKPTLESLQDYLQTLTEQADGKPAAALFVDYLQLIQSDKVQDVKDRLTQALISLKDYAKENNTFVYLISAISRSSNGHIDQASARDTSAIEYHANVILSIAPYKDQANTKPGETRMILKVLKDRDGSATNHYSIVFRNGANSIFHGTYKGGAQDPEPLPEWLESNDDEQIAF